MGSPIVGLLAIVIGLIDLRYHRRDWRHTHGTAADHLAAAACSAVD